MPELVHSPTSFDLYVAVLDRKGYIVGDTNANSGLHVLGANDRAALSNEVDAADKAWRHFGWNNVRCFGLDISHVGPSGAMCFLAGGNGVHSSNDLSRWRVTTDWRYTEVLDVIVARSRDQRTTHVVAATAYGPIVSGDYGASWQFLLDGIEGGSTSSTFCSAIAATADGTRLMLGTEDGVFTADFENVASGCRWRPTGPRGVSIRCVVEDAFKPGRWFAATDGSGLHVLDSVGRADNANRGALNSAVLYSVASSALKSGLIATGGFEPTVWISSDSGASFSSMPGPTESISIHALAFDPVNSDVLWVGTTDAGVYRVDLVSREWAFAGLTDASVRKLQFVPSRLFGIEL